MRSKPRQRSKWRPWFAWRPVRTIDGFWIWLETVERIHFMSREVSSEQYRESTSLISSFSYCYRALPS